MGWSLRSSIVTIVLSLLLLIEGWSGNMSQSHANETCYTFSEMNFEKPRLWRYCRLNSTVRFPWLAWFSPATLPTGMKKILRQVHQITCFCVVQLEHWVWILQRVPQTSSKRNGSERGADVFSCVCFGSCGWTVGASKGARAACQKESPSVATLWIAPGADNENPWLVAARDQTRLPTRQALGLL